MEGPASIFSQIGIEILKLWWFWGALLVGWIFLSLWLAWRQLLFKADIKWALLEIRIPREIKRSPKAMEQILAVMEPLRNTAGNIRESWWDGETSRWFSFEIVSFGGDIHFYVRTPAPYINIIKSIFYGHYPEIEMEVVDDYIDRLPRNMVEVYEGGYEMWGAEMILGKPDGYPIRTYTQLESDEEERNIDPIAGILEVLAGIQPEEVVMLQVVARPTNPLIYPQVMERVVTKLRADIVKKSPRLVELGEEGGIVTQRTPGETELLKLVEAKVFKPAFDCAIRYIYLAPQGIFNVTLPYRGIRTAFMQFSAPNLNFFQINYRTWTRAWFWDPPRLFPTRVVAGRKERMLWNYRYRLLPPDTWMGRLAQWYIWSSSFTQRSFILNIEELATVFHLPTAVVLTQPIIKRIESRKIGPPPGLPIFREPRGAPGIMKP